MADSGQTGPLSPEAIADWVNGLFDTHRKPGGSKYSNEEVAKGMSQLGFSATRAAVSYLRNAQRGKQTSVNLLAGIAAFFGVGLGGLIPGADVDAASQLAAKEAADQQDESDLSADEQLELLALLELANVTAAYTRLWEEVPSAQRRVVLYVLRQIVRRQQGEQAAPGDADAPSSDPST